METPTQSTALALAALPALGQPLAEGIFAGITTSNDGTHAAVILLPEKAQGLTWKKALAWAEKLGAQLPTRPVAALLFANVKSALEPRWHWTSEALDASYAWICLFHLGYQFIILQSYEGAAVAVRLIPLTD